MCMDGKRGRNRRGRRINVVMVTDESKFVKWGWLGRIVGRSAGG